MHFGVDIFPTDYSMPVAELGPAVEQRGFDTLLFPEHTHIPVSRRSPWDGGGELPQHYWHTLDPFVACGVVAATTTRLRFGTGICLIIERDPIVTAKEVASADFVSGGRFVFGVGGGWNAEEMEHHGTPYARRWTVMRERIQAMKRIWAEETPEYHGEFVNFDPIWSWPKPIQRPHPPIVVGGNGPHTLERVLKYGDVWMPVGRGSPSRITDRIPELQRLAAQRGRGPIPVWVFGAPATDEALEQFRRAGVERCLFGLPSAGADEVLPLLDRLAALAERFR